MSNSPTNPDATKQRSSQPNAKLEVPTEINQRVWHGWQIAETKGDKFRRRNGTRLSFDVPSENVDDLRYHVDLDEQSNRFTCTCKDYTENITTNRQHRCKHIFATLKWLNKISSMSEFLIQEEETKFVKPKCPRCESNKIISKGKSENGRKCLKCKKCRHRFRTPKEVPHAHYPLKVIAFSLDAYFSGLSYRATAATVNRNFNLNLRHSTIEEWVRKYIPLISEYVNSFVPQSTGVWHADELFLNVNDPHSIREEGRKIAYLWDIIDRGTRFLNASRLERRHNAKAAKKAFQYAVDVTHGQDPEIILTDKLPSYNVAIPQVFKDRPTQPQHIRRGLKLKKGEQPYKDLRIQRIERVHGTLRDRYKIMRNLKKLDSPVPEGERIHYNFVRSHMALQGQTPALRADIDKPPAEIKNKWGYLIAKAVEYQRSKIQKEL